MKRIALLAAALLLLAGCAAKQPPAPVQAAPGQPAPAPAPVSPVSVEAVPPLAAVRFVNGQSGWAGGKGVILASADSGRTWVRQYEGPATITAVEFTDTANGWALAPDALLRTIDGGKHWTPASVPDGSKALRQLDFVSATRGWVTDGNTLFASGDGGTTWAPVTVPGVVQSICFTSETSGWVAGNSAVYRTIDGGRSWQAAFAAPLKGEAWHARIHCTGQAAWVLFTGDVAMSQQAYIVFRTADAGATWQPLLKESYFAGAYPSAAAVTQQIDAESGPFNVVSADVAQFLGSCPACDSTVSITRTSDGGKTWLHDKIGGIQGFGPFAISFINADQGWLAATQGDHGAILATRDGGRTWQQAMPAVTR